MEELYVILTVMQSGADDIDGAAADGYFKPMNQMLFKTTVYTGILLFLVLFPAGGCGHYEHYYSESSEKEATEDSGDTGMGMKMKNYSWTDENGETVELYDFMGDVIVLNVGAGWCLPCREEAPLLESQIWQRYKDDGFTLIELLVEDDAASDPTNDFIKSWRQEYGLTYRVLADPDWSLLPYFPDPESPSLPFTAFIDRDMKMYAKSTKYEEESFAALIESAL